MESEFTYYQGKWVYWLSRKVNLYLLLMSLFVIKGYEYIYYKGKSIYLFKWVYLLSRGASLFIMKGNKFFFLSKEEI